MKGSCGDAQKVGGLAFGEKLLLLTVFALWCVLPGWFLQRALFATKSTGLVERVAVAFLMSLALAAIPGLLGLRLHWNIETFALAYGALAAVSSGLAYLFHSDRPNVQPESDDDVIEDLPAFPSIALRLLILIPLMAIFTSPWWEDGRISRDADDLVNAAYVREYSVAELDASEPFQNRAQGQLGECSSTFGSSIRDYLPKVQALEPSTCLKSTCRRSCCSW